MQLIQKFLRTCISVDGIFIVGIHKPVFNVKLLRNNKYIESLGMLPDDTPVKNDANFPDRHVEESGADIIYEIPNAFPFRGTTYINSAWADAKAGKPELITLPSAPDCSLSKMFANCLFENQNKSQKMDSLFLKNFFTNLPYPLKIALAQSTTDPDDLLGLLPLCCTVLFDDNGIPSGLMFKKGNNGKAVPDIHDHTLFELIGNNPYLPDCYKRVIVLKPGIQGKSEITGEWLKDSSNIFSGNSDHFKSNEFEINDGKVHQFGDGKSHVFEYLRRNSYIPWGHFAANTADDTVRYRVGDLTMDDMSGMRHLYYQRTYLRVAEQLHISLPQIAKTIPPETLENLRCQIIKQLTNPNLENNVDSKHFELSFNASLWGWNFGFDYAQSGYRLHASHQQIHQQYAMIPREIPNSTMTGRQSTDPATKGKESPNFITIGNGQENQTLPSYACGDMIAEFIESYKNITGKDFFDNYIKAIRSNKRTDRRVNSQTDNKNKDLDLTSSLIIYEDDNVILFVPKAQTSQWEIQLMALKKCGNIVEADTAMRASLDRGILLALQILERLGARMVTSIEFSKRFDSPDMDQRILYSFMPRLPESPGAFSEAQLRWINGHYPEDFAHSCRVELSILSNVMKC